ncbi:hypothetical protein ACHAXH_004032 [Discostella pseudostelligera]
MCLNRSKWGLAILFLTKCTVSTHAAVTLWHQRENFKGYYQRNFHDGVFGDGKPGAGGRNSSRRRSSIFNMIGLQQQQQQQQTGNDDDTYYSATAIDNASCDDDASSSIISAQSRKIDNYNRHFVPRFSRLSKRLPSRPVDCCAECVECMSMESIDMYDCRSATTAAAASAATTLAVPRGGHIHTVAGSVAAESAAATASAVTPYGLPLNVWKIIFQAILTTINVVCWLVPLKSKKISENKFGLSMANAFSGGVFLSLAFGHLIPECVHGFHNSGGGMEMNDALPYMIVLGGYLLIFFVEKVAFDAHEIMHEMEGGGGHHHHYHHHDSSHADSKDMANGSSPSLSRQESPGFKGRSAVILLGALAVHSILEMTALGLANSFGDSALLSLSIALHQPAESIALLVAFLKSGMPHAQIIQFLSIFSCMGPIGVAIGMAVNSFASPIVDATMLAVVAGTFVYVGATEVIPEEWEEPDHKWKKFFALISGIVSIFAITQYTMTLEGGF